MNYKIVIFLFIWSGLVSSSETVRDLQPSQQQQGVEAVRRQSVFGDSVSSGSVRSENGDNGAVAASPTVTSVVTMPSRIPAPEFVPGAAPETDFIPRAEFYSFVQEIIRLQGVTDSLLKDALGSIEKLSVRVELLHGRIDLLEQIRVQPKSK